LAKAIALLSGGLDSTLAVKLILDQGMEVEAVNFLTVFCTCTPKNSGCLVSKRVADEFGIKIRVFNISQDYLEMVKHPKYGYGRNMNPCLDCRIYMFKRAGEYMKEVGASFLVTGEVLGERPMSQRRDAMRIIERDSGLDGLILRPLSAKLLKPTIPEKEGLVDRERLLDIQGRSRKPQMRLASEYGLNDYPCPAGGCLLTDPGFARRMRDLMEHNPDFTLNDVHLLKSGRHFRLSPEAKAVVGRNNEENEKLLSMARDNDIFLRVSGFPGPITIARGKMGLAQLRRAAAVTARYSKAENLPEVKVWYRKMSEQTSRSHRDGGGYIITAPIRDEDLEGLRI